MVMWFEAATRGRLPPGKTTEKKPKKDHLKGVTLMIRKYLQGIL